VAAQWLLVVPAAAPPGGATLVSNLLAPASTGSPITKRRWPLCRRASSPPLSQWCTSCGSPAPSPAARSPRSKDFDAGRRDRSDKGRTGAIPVLVLGCAAVAVAIAAAVALGVLHVSRWAVAVSYGLLVLALTAAWSSGAPARPCCPAFPARLFALALAFTGSRLRTGLISDPASVLFTAAATVGGRVAAHTGHVLLDQETEDFRAPVDPALARGGARRRGPGVVVAPLLAALIGPHRVERGNFVIEHGGAALHLMIIGALLRASPRCCSPHRRPARISLRKDLVDSVRSAEPPRDGRTGFFIAVEGAMARASPPRSTRWPNGFVARPRWWSP